MSSQPDETALCEATPRANPSTAHTIRTSACPSSLKATSIGTALGRLVHIADKQRCREAATASEAYSGEEVDAKKDGTPSVMNFIFKTKQRTPAELVRHLRDAITRLDTGSGISNGTGASNSGGALSEGKRKILEEISKDLFQMKAILYGDGDNEPLPEVVAQLAQEVYHQDILQLLILQISRFEFEAKKDVSQIFNNLLRRQIGTRSPTVEYISQKPEIIFAALRGYENAEVALNTGMILREILRHEPLARILLHSDQ